MVVQEMLEKTNNSQGGEVAGLTSSTIRSIKSYLKNRWRLKISLTDILYFNLKKLCCFLCSRKILKKEKDI